MFYFTQKPVNNKIFIHAEKENTYAISLGSKNISSRHKILC